MTNQFKGTGVAIITPFTKEKTIDFEAFKKLINFQIKNHVEYIVTLGTTGESATLSKDEKLAVIDFVIETVNKRVPVVVGIGGNNTQAILKDIENISFNGIDAVLSVCPYYNKPQQEGIYQHYKTIAKKIPVPVIIYNVPGRTGTNISAETTLRLANDIKNIIAVKEASGNLTQVMDIIKNKPNGFLVISGDDAITLPIIAAGGDGVISVTANVFPKTFSEMVRLALLGKLDEARKNHYALLEIFAALFAEGSPGGIKAALSIKGLCQNYFRLPVVPVSKKTYERIENLVARINS